MISSIKRKKRSKERWICQRKSNDQHISKNSSAYNLANEYSLKIYDYLTKKLEEKYFKKRLEIEIDKIKTTRKLH